MLKNKAFIAFLAVVLAALSFSSCSEKSVTPVSPHEEAAGVAIFRDSALVLRIFNAQIDTNYENELVLDSGKISTIIVSFIGEDGKIMKSVEDEVDFVLADADSSLIYMNFPERIGQHAANSFLIFATGKKTGSTTATIRLDHEGHADFTSPQFTIRVK